MSHAHEDKNSYNPLMKVGSTVEQSGWENNMGLHSSDGRALQRKCRGF